MNEQTTASNEGAYTARAPYTGEHYRSLVSFYRTEIEDLQGRARTFLTLTMAVVGGKIVGWAHMDPNHPAAPVVHVVLVVGLVLFAVALVSLVYSTAATPHFEIAIDESGVGEDHRDSWEMERDTLNVLHHMAQRLADRHRKLKRSIGFSSICLLLAMGASMGGFLAYQLGG